MTALKAFAVTLGLPAVCLGIFVVGHMLGHKTSTMKNDVMFKELDNRLEVGDQVILYRLRDGTEEPLCRTVVSRISRYTYSSGFVKDEASGTVTLEVFQIQN